MYLNMKLWRYYPVAVYLDKDGQGPVDIADVHKIIYEVQDAAGNVYTMHSQLADAINSSMELNLLHDRDFLRPVIDYPVEMIESVFGIDVSPTINHEDERAMSIENLQHAYESSSPVVQKTIVALAKYATMSKYIKSREEIDLEISNATEGQGHNPQNIAVAISNNTHIKELKEDNIDIGLVNDDVKSQDDMLAQDDMGLVTDIELELTNELTQELENELNIDFLSDDTSEPSTEILSHEDYKAEDVIGILDLDKMALTQEMTDARCKYLVGVLEGIAGSEAALNNSIRAKLSSITDRYRDFCMKDFNADFNDNPDIRNYTLSLIEVEVFSFDEAVKEYTSNGSSDNGDDFEIYYNKSAGIFLNRYKDTGLQGHLKDHWASISSIMTA